MNWKKLIIGEWSWTRPFYSLGFIYFSLLLVAVFAGDRFIFHPPKTPYPEKEGFLTLPGDLQVAAYYRPSIKSNGPIILWSHGNAQNIGDLDDLMDDFIDRGYGTLAYDYPGYGKTPGSPSEQGCYDAALNAYEYLTQTLGYSPQQIILCGQSVGSGPSTWLATQREHRALVLISPFLSAFRTVTRIPLFPGDRFPNLKHIRSLTTPLLIIHGSEDEVVPFSQGERLFQESSAPKKSFLEIENAGHNNLFERGGDEIFEAFLKFHSLNSD